MDSRQWHVRTAALPVVLLVLGFCGCAKRPSIAHLSAPPPNGAAGAGTVSGGPGGQSAVSTGANEGARQNGAGLTTHGAAAHAVRPGANAAARTAGLTAATARSQAGHRGGPGTAGASAPGRASAVGRADHPGEEAAGGEATGRTANAGAAGGPEAAGPGPAASTAAESPMGTVVRGPGGVAAAGPTGVSTRAAARPAPNSYSAVPELHDIHFDFDRYAIQPDGAKTLDTDASWLRANPGALLLIEGHCDERGTNEYNLALGQHRAKSTLDYLVAQGIAASRITMISYGEERPLCAEHTEECWAKNRRAHFLVKAE
jgi:peptidoglycan-associated lipoprotein